MCMDINIHEIHTAMVSSSSALDIFEAGSLIGCGRAHQLTGLAGERAPGVLLSPPPRHWNYTPRIWLCLCFETGPHFVALAGLEFTETHLPLPSEGWD